MDSHLLRVIPSLLWVRVSFLANSTRFTTLSPCRSIIAASVDQRSNAGCDRAAPRITTGLPNPVAKPPARNSSALSSDLTSSMGPAQFGRSNIATVDVAVAVADIAAMQIMLKKRLQSNRDDAHERR